MWSAIRVFAKVVLCFISDVCFWEAQFPEQTPDRWGLGVQGSACVLIELVFLNNQLPSNIQPNVTAPRALYFCRNFNPTNVQVCFWVYFCSFGLCFVFISGVVSVCVCVVVELNISM